MSAIPLTSNLTVAESTTQQLTRIWENLLGVHPIEPDQNYFDLGGDSILAVQMFAQIDQMFQVKLPVATLFEAPTIGDLAQIVNREAPKSRWSSLVTIQPKGKRPPFFCIHGAGGNVLIYRELSKYLGEDQPFYGLQSQGLDGDSEPLTRIEDMAASYVREIRRAQPEGPYYLGGYCAGRNNRLRSSSATAGARARSRASGDVRYFELGQTATAQAVDESPDGLRKNRVSRFEFCVLRSRGNEDLP